MINLWSNCKPIQVQSAVFDYACCVWARGGWHYISLGDNCINLWNFWLCTVIHTKVEALISNVEALGSQYRTGIARLVPQFAHSSCKTSHHKLW